MLKPNNRQNSLLIVLMIVIVRFKCGWWTEKKNCVYLSGNRGMLQEIWTSTTKSFATIDDILALTDTAADYASSFTDETYYVNNSGVAHVMRMSGFFVPNISGAYRFFIKCDNYATLYFSSTHLDPSAKVRMHHANIKKSFTKMYTSFQIGFD